MFLSSIIKLISPFLLVYLFCILPEKYFYRSGFKMYPLVFNVLKICLNNYFVHGVRHKGNFIFLITISLCRSNLCQVS